MGSIVYLDQVRYHTDGDRKLDFEVMEGGGEGGMGGHGIYIEMEIIILSCYIAYLSILTPKG